MDPTTTSRREPSQGRRAGDLRKPIAGEERQTEGQILKELSRREQTGGRTKPRGEAQECSRTGPAIEGRNRTKNLKKELGD